MKYFDLSRLGHSPSCAHFEFETNLMLLEDNPAVLADKYVNPKKKNAYNLFDKWRKIIWG